MIIIRLFYEFFKVGLFAVGGGMATVPFLYALAEKTNWFTATELTNMIAISESTPGPIGVNMATYVGFTSAGVPGAIIASIGLVTPSVIVVLIVAAFLDKFRTSPYVDSAFYGVRAASAGLIASSAVLILSRTVMDIPLYKISGALSDLFDIKLILLAAVIFVLMKLKWTKKLHPIVFIAISAVAGVVFRLGGS